MEHFELLCSLPCDLYEFVLGHLDINDKKAVAALNRRARTVVNSTVNALKLTADDLIHAVRPLAASFPSVKKLVLSDARCSLKRDACIIPFVTDEVIQNWVITQHKSATHQRASFSSPRSSLDGHVQRHCYRRNLNTACFLQQLTELDLKSCSYLTAQGVHALLRATPNLQSVRVPRWADAASLHDLPGLRKLCTLCMGDTEVGVPAVDDEALEVISKCTSLTNIYLDRCVAITDHGLATLGSLAHLNMLSMSACKQLTGGTLYLLTSLATLDLNGCSLVHDASVMAAAPCWQNLLNLKLAGTACTNRCLMALSQAPQLQHLDLGSAFEVVDEGVTALAVFPALKHLVVGNVNITVALGKLPGSWPNIHSIKFGGTYFNKGLRFLFPMGPHLKCVTACGYNTVTDNVMGIISRQQTSLTHLHLQAGYQLTDTGVQALSSLPCLQEVTITACPLVTTATAARLAETGPAAQHVTVRKSLWQPCQEQQVFKPAAAVDMTAAVGCDASSSAATGNAAPVPVWVPEA